MYVLQRGSNTQHRSAVILALGQNHLWQGFLRDVKGWVGRITDSPSCLLFLGSREGHSGSEDGPSRHGIVGDSE